MAEGSNITGLSAIRAKIAAAYSWKDKNLLSSPIVKEKVEGLLTELIALDADTEAKQSLLLDLMDTHNLPADIVSQTAGELFDQLLAQPAVPSGIPSGTC